MIRTMEKNDVEKVHKIVVMSFTDPWSEEIIRACVESVSDYCIVDEDKGRITGFGVLSKSIDTADILDIAVDSDYRRQGIAGRILDELINHGRKYDIRGYALEVRPSNIPAIKLYESKGFVKESVRKNYYKNPTEDANIMWKRIRK